MIVIAVALVEVVVVKGMGKRPSSSVELPAIRSKRPYFTLIRTLLIMQDV